MMHCNAVTTMCAALVAASAAVTGMPHQCLLDGYAKAMLTQYYPAEMAAAMAEAARPVALEYEEPSACRSGRSNDRVAVPVADAVAPAAEPVAQAVGPTALPAPGGANDTSSVSTIEKLAAYYDQLRGQQEALVRDQLQKQLYAQQRTRQQEFMLTVQQMQQQYQQQQEHALLMLEQLRKNPAFAGQLSTYSKLTAVNGTAVALPQAAAAAAATAAAPSPPSDVAEVLPPTGDGKTTAKQAAADDEDVGDCEAKHPEPRHAVDREPAEDRPTFEDDQTSPVLEKVYSMVAE